MTRNSGAYRPVPPRRPKKSSGPLIIVVAVIFLAAIVGVGFFVYNMNQPEAPETPQLVGGQPSIIPQPRRAPATQEQVPTTAEVTGPIGTEQPPSTENSVAVTTKPATTTQEAAAIEEPEPVEPIIVPTEPGEVIASAAENGHWTHHFVFHPNEHVNTVAVAGDFNGWSTDANLMKEAGGTFEATVPMSEGVHMYKFVVDGKWITDPQGDHQLEEPDTYGGQNSGVMVGPDGRNLPQPDRKSINISAVRFSPDDARDCDVVSTRLLELSIRVQADGLTDAGVWIRQGKNKTWERHELTLTDRQSGFDRYTALLSIDAPYLRYNFELDDGTVKRYVASGKAYALPESGQDVPYKVYMKPTFDTPEWAKHVIWYQIFPERFRNGDPSNDPEGTQKWTSKWFSTLPGETGKFYKDVWSRRYGGDFQGILWSLPYLRKLGVNAIYLNPIFKANDLHKYDTTDYRHVDDTFGYKGDLAEIKGETEDPATWQWSKTDKLFLSFLGEAHHQGFKVIIDGVFNHVGRANWAFQDVMKNGRNSKYADWFDVTSWSPFHYRAWDGNDGALPIWRKDQATGLVHGPREHIMAITKRWLAPDGDPSKGVDGFRLDVPNEVPSAFWVDWRRVVKQTHPGAYISGEIWTPAQAWLQGDQFDATMNYPFAKECQRFFVNKAKASTPSEFAGHMQNLVSMYPFQVSLVMQNLFDSHDTDRWASQFVNYDLDFKAHTRIQDNGPQYSPAKPSAEDYERIRQSVAFQMTFVGAPMIYYGDEVGMWSPDDPSNREPMTWKDLEPYDDPDVKFNTEQFNFYQWAIAVRRQIPTLQVGLYHTVKTDNANGTLVYERSLNGENAYVALNRSDQEHLVEFRVDPSDKDTFLMDWLDADNFSVKDAPVDQADGRPVLVRRADAKGKRSLNSVISVLIPAYGTAVLARPPALAN